MDFPLAERFFKEYNNDRDRNYLISAPTGSGKTHIAKRVLVESKGISVYVSPLKALSREVYLSIKDKTRAVMVDSDVYEEDLRKISGDVLLTTYEKFDSAIRHNYSWLNNVSKIIIDEVHNVESDRGLALENLVLWAKSRKVPLIALSATLSEPERYVRWLDARLISHDKRTVPLHECVAFPYVLRCGEWEENLKPSRLTRPRFELLVLVLQRIVSMGKNALVFVKSRRSAETLALELQKRDFKANHYHSGLSHDERRKVLDMLMEGNLNVVVSTTALGQGVNLPVYAVVFYELKLPDVDERGEFKGWKDVSPAEFKQMAGRAGRPRYDKEGMAIIIANSEKFAVQLEEKYYRGRTKAEVIKPDLDTLSLAFVSWNDGVDIDDLGRSLNSTFNFRGIENSVIESSVLRLREMKLVTTDQGVTVTPLGRAVAVSYIDVKALSGFPIEDKGADLLTVIASSSAVAQSLRGCKEGKELLTRWMSGNSLDGVCEKLTSKDLGEVISNAKWISFAMFRVLRALGDDRFRKALEIHDSLKYGVPPDGVKLAKSGLTRDAVVHVLSLGIKDLRELCMKVGYRELRDELRRSNVQIELMCREVYSNDPLTFDVRRAIQEYRQKEFSLKEVSSRFGGDVLREMVKLHLLRKRGERYVIRDLEQVFTG
ncbi:ATP-dependent DNA helicase [Metallosphaera sp. J1]|uniref:DEAD/DEAH box helicase n=1 Tax=Metallosphaera TaxID=41980 RepID=UPI001EDCB9C9|nr:DEAD/DEAH box helicase [Metallosphaera javensis (ex Hofmann et al. 2022)]MCG3108285.1 ATP-dependent DNA helicase [Metallosphaera javensis (ex Hofmann et al. 2022)]BCS93834.1 MAG: DEAD/DEAH box helicase [Metallosphaera javensis (ex Sakai et al. 2022)]